MIFMLLNTMDASVIIWVFFSTAFATTDCFFLLLTLSLGFYICFFLAFSKCPLQSPHCWETILPGSFAFLHILYETLTSFCFTLPLQGYVYSKQPWRISMLSYSGGMPIVQYNKGIVSLRSKRQEDFILYKRFGFLISGFLTCNPDQCICGHQYGTILIDLWDLGVRRTAVNMLTLMVLAETWVIKCIFIDFIESESHVFYWY